MSVPDPTKLAEAVRRGKLSRDEEAQLQQYLASHPGEQASWDEELALNHLLAQAPDRPISSNFTSRVLQAVQASERDSTSLRQPLWHRVVRGWIPKVAGTIGVACLGLIAYQHHQSQARQELARSMAEFSTLASGNAIELLQNFDAIARLDQVPREADRQLAGDRELIAALQ